MKNIIVWYCQSMKIILRLLIGVAISLLAVACVTRPPMPTVESVNLEEFMGDWYVIANIPTFIERNAYNAVENYQLGEDDVVLTTFTFNKGSFDGELKTYKPKGFVNASSNNAEWGMQFIWPIKADYRIVHLTENYQDVIIGRKARDYVWIMSRSPKISDQKFESLKKKVADLGYDASLLRKVPQQSLEERS